MIKSGLRWNYFYYTLLGASVLDLMVSSALFWKENAASYRAKNHRGTDSGGGSRTTEAMKSPITWLIAVWLFVYMGVEGASIYYIVESNDKLMNESDKYRWVAGSWTLWSRSAMASPTNQV